MDVFIYIIFGLAAFFLVFSSMYMIFIAREKKMTKNMYPCKGTVIGFEKARHPIFKSKERVLPVIDYFADGEPHKTSRRLFARSVKYGDVIEMYYDPKNGENIYIKNPVLTELCMIAFFSAAMIPVMILLKFLSKVLLNSH